MDSIQIREMTMEDSQAIISLNESVVHVASPMDAERFTSIYELSSKRLVAQRNGKIVGFIMAIADGKAYDNDNYRWFSDRFKNFIYVDRIVISESSRGLGIGRRFYMLVYYNAQQFGLLNVCAEMDLEPPNAESLRFHRKSGFVEIGTRQLKSGKIVSMQVRPV